MEFSRQRISSVRRTWMAASVVAAGLSIAGIGGAISASAATTLGVSAGAETTGGAIQLNEFAPTALTVNVGDTVTWSLNSTEFHTVSFMGGAPTPPFVNAGPTGVFINPAAAFPVGGKSYEGTGVASSGLMNKGDKYSLTFSKAGTYEYVCIIHGQMKGRVVVADAGKPADTAEVV